MSPQHPNPRNPFSRHQGILLFVVLLIGFLFFFPRLDFQPGIAQGDHGRDLYAAQRVLAGERPYRDFWWPYGPLMPYYYSFFFRWFGTSLHSIMLGKMVLYLLAGVFFFLCCHLFTTPYFALTGTLWFYVFNPEMTHTYNHFGAVSLFMPMIFLLLSYLRTGRAASAYGGLFIVFLIFFIKFNIGLSNLLAFVFSVWVIDRMRPESPGWNKRIFYITSLGLIPFLAFTVYSRMLAGLPSYYLRQCLPYSIQDTPYTILLPMKTATLYFKYSWSDIIGREDLMFFTPLIVLSGLNAIFLLFNKGQPRAVKVQKLLPVLILVLFSLVNLHEFIFAGIYYQLYWTKPFDILISFLLVALFWERLPFLHRSMILSGVLLLVFYFHLMGCEWIYFLKSYTRVRFLSFEQGRFYAQNTGDWFETIKGTKDFLEKNLRPDERFLAVPYDGIYYFLLNRKNPVREIAFFNYMNIPEEQEKNIMSQLEDQGIRWIVMSNRSRTAERDLGSFGETHCRLLSEYIDKNFLPVKTFGDWNKEPGYMWNHATRIYQRRGIAPPAGTQP